MKRLRSLHLWLGCLFAPLILFFAVSGVWQTLGLHDKAHPTLARLSSIHVAREMKSGDGLGSPALRVFIVAMSIGLAASTLLGIVMALKSGNRRTALLFLAAGVLLPGALIALRVLQSHNPSITP